MVRALGALLLAAAPLLLAASPARAATPLMIWPVDPIIVGPQRAVALWLENRGERAVSMQVRVFAWSQAGGEEAFNTQKAIAVSPPISHIPPGQRQMVRLISVPPPSSERQEQAFRVLIDELPASASMEAPSPPETPQVAVRLQIRYALPLFVYDADAVPPRQAEERGIQASALLQPALSWQLVHQGATPRLLIRNDGTAHARITSASWSDGARSDLPIGRGLLGYVLPHSHMLWPLEQSPPAGHVLKATVNGREAPLPRAAQ
jgi:fimbrial chaperone protein